MKKFAVFSSSPYCKSRDFVLDNELNISINKEFCQITDVDEDSVFCIDSILENEKLSKDVVRYYSFRQIVSLSRKKILTQSLNSLESQMLTCYAHTFIDESMELNTLSEEQVDFLANEFLPNLSASKTVSGNTEDLKIWFQLIKKSLKDNPIDEIPKFTKDKRFQLYLYLNFINKEEFYKLSATTQLLYAQKILELSILLKINLPVAHLELLSDFFLKNGDSIELPTELIFKSLSNPIYEKLVQFTTKKLILNSSDKYKNFFSKNIVTNLESLETHSLNKCAIIEEYYNEFSKHVNTKEQVETKIAVLEYILNLNQKCPKVTKLNILTELPYTEEYASRWCPASDKCDEHFKNVSWSKKFAYCSLDAECKSFRAGNCDRLYFNSLISKFEIMKYTKFCEFNSVIDKIDPRPTGTVCRDNFCQEKL